MDTAELEAEIDSIAAVVRHADETAQAGIVPDMTGLDGRVQQLLQRVRELDPAQRDGFRGKLEGLTAAVDRLYERVRALQTGSAPEAGERARRAANAYGQWRGPGGV